MKCFNCGYKMIRDEHITITYFGLVSHPQKSKSGWICPECESIKFDVGEKL